MKRVSKITPIEAYDAALKRKNRPMSFPDGVCQIWNSCISNRFDDDDGKAIVKVETVRDRLHQKYRVIETEWLDPTKEYESAGWNVQYDADSNSYAFETRYVDPSAFESQ